MFFINNTEIDMNYYYNNLYKRLLLLKLKGEKKNELSLIKELKVFFIFRNIIIVGGLYIYNYFLFVWLTTGLLLVVKNYNYVFQRGIYYYRFMLTLKSSSFVL